MQRLITVIPVYNGERYLAETLDSVARQTRRPDRLVVLDNCSTDNTKKVVEDFKGMQCEWLQNEKNLGLFGNCNRALDFSAEADFLHILHADDLLKPRFYEVLLKAVNGHPGRALLHCQCEFIDEKSALNSTPATQSASSDVREIPRRDFLIGKMELRPFYFPTVLLKTNAQVSACQFRLDLPQLADLVFWAEWAAHCSHIMEVPDVLCQYRVHDANTTAANMSAKSQQALQIWVLDEWKAMQIIRTFLQETGFKAWLQQERLKCIFAARSQVKIQMVGKHAPDFAKEIARVTKETVGLVPWLAGTLAVKLRDSKSGSRKGTAT